MQRKTRWLVAAALLAASSGFLVAQGNYRERTRPGPWRVVISKPLVGLGYTAGELWREHEYLSAMLNELDTEGLAPVLTEVMTQTLEGREDEQRLLVICRSR